MEGDEEAIPTLQLRDVAPDERNLECQVSGCTNPLPGRAYHKRYKICQQHAMAPKMILDSQLVRWCQQCGKFQHLDEFDPGRKTCRKKLDLHNAQRKRARARRQGLLVQTAVEAGPSLDAASERHWQFSGMSSGATEPSEATGTTATAVRAPPLPTAGAALQGPEMSCDAFPPAMVHDVQLKAEAELRRTRRGPTRYAAAGGWSAAAAGEPAPRYPSGFDSTEHSLEPTAVALPSLPAQGSLPLPPRGAAPPAAPLPEADCLEDVDIDALLADFEAPLPAARPPGAAAAPPPPPSRLESWAAFDPSALSPLSGVHAALAARAGAAQLVFPDAGSLTPHHPRQQYTQQRFQQAQQAQQQQQRRGEEAPGGAVAAAVVAPPKKPRPAAAGPGGIQSWHASLLPPPEARGAGGAPQRATSEPLAPDAAGGAPPPSAPSAEAIHAASMQLFNMSPSQLPPVIYESLVGTLQAQELLGALPGLGAAPGPRGYGTF